MKLSLGQIMEIAQALGTIVQQPLKPMGAYWVARLSRKINEETKTIEESRNALVLEYAGDNVNSDGNPEVPSEKQSEFFVEVQKLYAQEIEIDLPTIKVEHLDGATLTPVVLMMLGDLVTE